MAKWRWNNCLTNIHFQTWNTSTGPAPITTSLKSYLGPSGLGDPDVGVVDWSEGATIFSQKFPDGLPGAAVEDADSK